jgi:hypothetical protein
LNITLSINSNPSDCQIIYGDAFCFENILYCKSGVSLTLFQPCESKNLTHLSAMGIISSLVMGLDISNGEK